MSQYNNQSNRSILNANTPTSAPSINVDQINSYTPNGTISITAPIDTVGITDTGGISTPSLTTPSLIVTTGEFTSIDVTNINDLGGNGILSTVTAGTPTFQQSISLNNNNITSVGTLTTANLSATTLQGTLSANANNITNCNNFNAASISSSGKVECPTYCDILGNSWLTVGSGGQPTITNTLQMNSNPIVFGTAVTSSDQTLATLGSSSTARLVFKIGSTANDFNGKIIFGGSGSYVQEVPSVGLQIASAGYYIQLVNPLAVGGIGLTDQYGHIYYQSNVPSIVAYGGAGGVAVIEVLSGSDMSGIIYLQTTTTGAAGGLVATLTFVHAWPQAPNVVMFPSSASAAALSGTGAIWLSNTTTTGFSFSVGSTALPANTYLWRYICMF